ncbi:MAG TPA: GNAT family N-acetyltransferase [Gemmatimonadaceae bacterium]|nr:GNAT family N-acetyltransferase [Gemmatimonadaceae bacterium]
MNARDLMRLHVQALYTMDARGRLDRVNEPGGGPAPRFFLGRTREGNEWWFRHDVDDAVAHELEALAASETVSDDLRTSRVSAARYEALLARVGPVQRTESGPAYWVPPSESSASPDVVHVTGENVDLLHRYLTPWLGDVVTSPPLFALLHDGHGVAVCASVRITPLAHEAGVETHLDFRGRGYAPHVVAAWAEAVRALGAVPLYSTSWQNTASQAVARKLGLVRFGGDLHFT